MRPIPSSAFIALVTGSALIAGQVHLADEDVSRMDVETGPAALFAGPGAQELRELLAHRPGLGLAVSALDVGNDALEGVATPVGPPPLLAIDEFDLFFAAPVEHDLPDRFRQRTEGKVEIEGVVPRQRFEHLEVVDVSPVPARDRPAGQAQVGVGHESGGVEEGAGAEPVAGRTGAGGDC